MLCLNVKLELLELRKRSLLIRPIETALLQVLTIKVCSNFSGSFLSVSASLRLVGLASVFKRSLDKIGELSNVRLAGLVVRWETCSC
jgi:hypothetical protein